jgi:hypothetical protein
MALSQYVERVTEPDAGRKTFDFEHVLPEWSRALTEWRVAAADAVVGLEEEHVR